MFVASTSRSHIPFNPEPITKKGIQEQNHQLSRIFVGCRGNESHFVTVAAKVGGTALGAIFEKKHQDPTNSKPCKRWIGKVGEPGGLLRNDPNTVRTRTRKEINVDTIREKEASDLYEELGRGIFRVPKTRLSMQPISNEFTEGHPLVAHWISMGIQNSLQIMSQFTEGYQDFKEAKTLDEEGNSIGFIDFIERYHRPPDKIIGLDGALIPLRGFVGLLAVGRVLADTDVVGGSGGNAGFIIEEGIAQTVKIDPGFAFQFVNEGDRSGVNWVINTRRKLGPPMLDDIRDLQISNGNQDVTVKWNSFTDGQKDEFLAAMFNCSRYLRSEKVLHFLFYRDGHFTHSDIEQIPEEVARTKVDEMTKWMRLQLDIYHNELTDFRNRYPHQVLKAHYVDNWGELPLPMSEETLPIRELFTQLLITEGDEVERPEKGSLEESFGRMQLEESLGRLPKNKTIAMEDLFNQKDSATPIHKVLVVGQPATGKSTLCQKIAHDWASDSPSGQVWRDRFETAVYWIPLRFLNEAVTEGGYLYEIDDRDLFLALTVSHILLKDPSTREGILQQIKASRQQVLVILDGLDEATEELSHAIAPLFSDPELHILLTSRPGVTANLHPQMDRIVENVGFSEQQVKTYANQFFTRKENSAEGEKNAKIFLEAVAGDSNLSSISYIPLQLQMLCSMWEQGARESGSGQNIARLYQNMVEQLFLWQYNRHRNQREGKDLSTISSNEMETYFSLLGEIGHQALSTGQLVITRTVIEEICLKRGIAEKTLLNTGLLKVIGEKPEKQYAFPHLTFQEYLIAHSVSRMSIREQHAFILENRLKPRYQQAMVFLAGITHQLDSSDGKAQVKNFFESLYDSSADVPVKVQLELILRCLKECPDYEGPVSEKLESFIREDLSLWLSEQERREPTSSRRRPAKRSRGLKKRGRSRIVLPLRRPILYRTLSNNTNPFAFVAGEGNIPGMRWLHRMEDPLCSKPDGMLSRTSFHEAARQGKIEAMEWLYAKDPSLCSKPDKYGMPPFHKAALFGKIEKMDWLHAKDPSLCSKPDNDGQTPFHYVAYEGKIVVMDWLHAKDPSLCSKPDNVGGTPFHEAAAMGKIRVMEWLHDKDPSLYNKPDNDGRTPFHYAAYKGKIVVMDWLYTKDPSLCSKPDNDGRTPFHEAAMEGKIEAMEWLHDKDPSLYDKPTNGGPTPFHYAAWQGEIRAMEWLYNKDSYLFSKMNKQSRRWLERVALREAKEWLLGIDLTFFDGIESR